MTTDSSSAVGIVIGHRRAGDLCARQKANLDTSGPI
jgi:hypothetical protein